MAFVQAAKQDELWPGEVLALRVGGESVLLAAFDSGVVAYEDRCPHQGVPLSKGRLDGCVLTCSAHQWQFDLQSGRGVNPESSRLRRYPVRIEGDAIWVDPKKKELCP
jgi:toluene monooxygenase system ferredoxin subunit